jgi:hypothetical protein
MEMIPIRIFLHISTRKRIIESSELKSEYSLKANIDKTPNEMISSKSVQPTTGETEIALPCRSVLRGGNTQAHPSSGGPSGFASKSKLIR